MQIRSAIRGAHVRLAQKSAPSVRPFRLKLLLKLLLRPLRPRQRSRRSPFSVTLTLASLAAWVLILQAFVQKCTALCGLQALSLLVSL